MSEQQRALAKVLSEHGADVTSYDAGDIHGCECGLWFDRTDYDTLWGQYYDHLAQVVIGHMRTPQEATSCGSGGNEGDGRGTE